MDFTGLPIENAKLQIDSDALNVGPYSVNTDNLGHFRFADIPPETYHLDINVPGFKTWRKTDIRLLSGQQTSLGEAFLLIGEFISSNLMEKHYTIAIFMIGFYREILPNVFITRNMDWTYFPILLERCPPGGCDKTPRRKVIGLCE